MKTIDLNADIGEADCATGQERERRILAEISSANIACGGHRGTPASMRRLVQQARIHRVRVGAHPSYPDPDNFGRRSLILGQDISPQDLYESLHQQISDLAEICKSENTQLTHVKPHGALYNDAAIDKKKAAIVAHVMTDIDPDLILLGPASSQLEQIAKPACIRFVSEGFIDRRYMDDGRLQPRTEPGAVLSETPDQLKQLRALVSSKALKSANGQDIHIKAETLCLHADHPKALKTAQMARREIENMGVKIQSFST